MTVVSPIAKVDPDTGVQVAVPTPSTASLVAGESYVTIAPADEAASIGPTSAWESITGIVVSSTVTLKVVEIAALPAASEAIHVTVVSPKANVDPERGAHDAVLVPSTASLVAGEVYVTAAPSDEVASAIMSAGVPDITGATVSCTVTVNIEGAAAWPAASVFVQVTVVTPIGKIPVE